MSINTRQLEVFLAASETLNFTQAAQKLNISQPSVSQHIQALEEHFGMALFSRSGRTIELSDAGNTLLPLAREIVYMTARLEESMSSIKEGVHGHLRLGCGTATGRYIIPRVLACYHQICPQVRATCVAGSQAEVLSLLSDGKIQLAFTGSQEEIQDIEFTKLSTETVRLIVPARHPLAAKDSIALHELNGVDVILPPATSDIYEIVSLELTKAGFAVKNLSSQLTMGNLESIALSVQEGLGVAFVPDLVIDQLTPDSVQIVDIQGVNIEMDLYLARNLRRSATAAQIEFSKLIQEIDLSQLRCGKYKLLETPEDSDLELPEPVEI